MLEKKIKIAHIMGKMNSGGVESFIMNYYRHIDKEKFQFDFIVDSDSEVPQKKEIEKYGGNIIYIPPYQSIFKYIKTLCKIFEKEKYKIVHSHLNALSVIPLGCAFWCEVPVRIAHSHSTTNRKEWKKDIIKKFFKKFSKTFATDYFACTKHAGIWLFGQDFLKKGIVINNAIDFKRFEFNENNRRKIRTELNLEDSFVIGHVGRFVQQKNHDLLLQIFINIHNKIPKCKLILIGEGPLEKKIRNDVIDNNLENDVIFLGTRDNVEEYMSAMDMFVFPSIYEGLGMVTIEAQVNGLRVLASTDVPREAKITDNIEFLSLDNKSIWIEKILDEYEMKNIRHESIKISNFAYDIHKEAIKLEKIYLEYNERN